MTALKAVTTSTGATTRGRMVTVAALAAGAVLALSGCSAGQISQTAAQVPAVNGNKADIGDISLRNLHIVFPPAGEHTNAKGGKALIALSLINNSEITADELTSISTDLGQVQITPPSGASAVKIGPQKTVVVAASKSAESAKTETHGDTHGTGPSATATTTPAAPADHNTETPAGEQSTDPEKNPAYIEITGLTKDITPGLTYTVTFNFNKNGTRQVEVPVDAGTEAERHVSDKSRSSEGAPAGGH